MILVWQNEVLMTGMSFLSSFSNDYKKEWEPLEETRQYELVSLTKTPTSEEFS